MSRQITLTVIGLFAILAEPATANVSDLYDSRPNVRLDTYEYIVTVEDSLERHSVVEGLIHILDSGNVDQFHEGTLHLTTRALGVLKTSRAIPSLLPYFTFTPNPFIIREIIPTQWYYPTAIAFTRIGAPTLPFMDSLITDQEQTDEAKRLAAWVVMEIVGKDTAIARLRTLEGRADTAKLASGVKLSEYIRTFKITFHHPHSPPKDKRLDTLRQEEPGE